MTTIHVLWALVVVAAMSLGQLLFKTAGLEIRNVGTWTSWRVLVLVAIAGVIYAAATFIWINLLRHVPLGKAYMFVALSFLLVPLASHYVFREPLNTGHWIGTGLVIAGIIISVLWQ